MEVHYAGNSVDEAKDNGRWCYSGDIQASWDGPIENPESHGIVCATFVSMAVWQAGLIDEETINKYSYHGCSGVHNILTDPQYKDEWQIIYNWDELQEGDVVRTTGHVFIYIDGEKCLDQNYCAITSGGADLRRKLLDASWQEVDFVMGYRYIGKKGKKG